VNADGTQLTALTDDAFWDNWPSWSPDGSQLAFTCRQSTAGQGGICAINADGSNRRQLSNANDWEPSWSPDGQHIVFASTRDGNPEIYLMNADGSQERRLTHDPADDWQASWSPDSTHLAFVSARDGEWEIYLMDVSDGGIAGDSQLVRLTDNEVADGFPDWSPDGTRIVYRVQPDPAGGQAEGYWVIDVDGTGRTALPGQSQDVARWTADGRIVVDCPEGTCITDADGSNRAVLLPGTAGAVPSPDGTRVARVTGTGIKTDIIVTTRDQTTQTALIP
jgi:Tol biopolymer transport system component